MTVSRSAAAETLRTTGERLFISRIRSVLPSFPGVVIGAGDDCAVVSTPPPGKELVFKCDPVVEGHHFLSTDAPRKIGRKALARVLSDFAAMGADPKWALADFSAPPETPLKVADEILAGFCDLARSSGVSVVGGDTSSGDCVSIHVFCAGTVDCGMAMRRDAAKVGDLVFTTGTLGGSFQSGHHFNFEPRLAEGSWLRKRGVRCAIDISDGLASEAWHLTRASNVSIFLDQSLIPVSSAALQTPAPLEAALGDGEDFELLFTAPANDVSLAADFRSSFPKTKISAIGRVGEPIEGKPQVLLERPGSVPTFLSDFGFDHFSSKK